nr:putative ribonuclease H-like domain-containing protein [Tanacetum cinerariifolium]
MNGAKSSSNIFHKSHSPVRRTFNQRTTPKNSDLKETINTAKGTSPSLQFIKRLMVDLLHLEEVLKENRVLVIKPHNKKPYELLIGRSPNLDFMRPFGCPVTILNTLDHLGKFEGKADEGFLVGYSVNITVGNQTNHDARIEIYDNAGQAGQEKAFDHEYILLPFMPSLSTQMLDDKDADEVPGKGDEGEALKHQHCVDAMNSKINALYRNNTLELTDLPEGRKAKGSREGIDCDEKFSPIVKIVTVRYLKGSLSKGINVIKGSASGIDVKAYTDADWARRTDTRRHGDTDLHDDFSSNFNQDDVERLFEFLVPLRPPPRHLLYVCRLTTACRHPGLSFSIKDQDKNVISMDTFLKLPTWTGTIVSKGDPIPEDQRPKPRVTPPLPEEKQSLARVEAKRAGAGQAGGLKKKQKVQKQNEPTHSRSEETLFASSIRQAHPEASKKPATVIPMANQPSPPLDHDDADENPDPNKNRFRRGTIDKTMFIKKDRDDILLVQVYVDDIIFGSTKKSLCDEFEQMMHKRFQMTSIWELTFFLGLQVK